MRVRPHSHGLLLVVHGHADFAFVGKGANAGGDVEALEIIGQHRPNYGDWNLDGNRFDINSRY